MPTYEYECKSCAHTFEIFQSMADDALTECPECGKEIRRIIGGGMGIIFKGSGFYVTDNRGGSAGSNGNAASGGNNDSSSSSDSGSKGDSSSATSSDKKSSDSKPKKEVKK